MEWSAGFWLFVFGSAIVSCYKEKMEKRTEFNQLNFIEKLLFKLSISTICVFTGNLFLLLLMVFYEESFILPKFWIWVNIFVILILGGIIIHKLKLNYQNILGASFFAFMLFPIFWMLLPIKIPQDYIGLRKVDKEEFILSDEFCRKDCQITSNLLRNGFYKERGFYSWRYALLLGRNPADDSCCYKLPIDSDYFFGFLILFELTFEYFPSILFLAILITLIEYYRRKELDLFSIEFISSDEYDIRKIIVFGIILIVGIISYNTWYMNSN